MRQISIANNEFGSEGVAVLADFIGGNYCAKDLWLDHNKISDSDTPLLASALRTNTHLHRLDLALNNITDAGRKNMLIAVFNTTSVDSIVHSNHSCLVHYSDIGRYSDIESVDRITREMPANEREIYNINLGSYSIGEKIRKKVVLALCGNNTELFDLSHLNNVPLQLMPRVLELLQKHSEYYALGHSTDELDKEALSRLFHTLRGWKMPLLFVNLRLTPAVARKRKRNTPH